MKSHFTFSTFIKFTFLLAVTIYAVSYHFCSNPFDGTTDIFGWLLILFIALAGTVISEMPRLFFRRKPMQGKLAGNLLNLVAIIIAGFGSWYIVSIIESVLGQT
ncbi:hypothetical protein [Desulfosarcina ovata]|uniref:hypothetical protein n=1 Tax=Desulfosarcina ovata TaxID=83564 RepID=UPI0012D314CC|nr:hypothetical protein [Desulfosarcina ovata]